MKIDAHQHFWRYTSKEYGWIDDSMRAIQQDFLPFDLRPLLQRAGFDGTVAVQARQTLEETRWLLTLAEHYSFIKGVVGWVDLKSDHVDDQLQEISIHQKCVGVRHVVQDEPDDRFLLRESVMRGISKLRDYDLTYDLLILPKHLPVACELVAIFPDQPFVVDHMAKPLIREQIMSPWEEGIRRLASFDNVYCKVSGMATEADWQNWQSQDFLPYLDVVFDAFGPERLMTGSDWPVCTLAGSYQHVLQIVIDYLEQFSDQQKAAVRGDNAARFYQLK